MLLRWAGSCRTTPLLRQRQETRSLRRMTCAAQLPGRAHHRPTLIERRHRGRTTRAAHWLWVLARPELEGQLHESSLELASQELPLEWRPQALLRRPAAWLVKLRYFQKALACQLILLAELLDGLDERLC